MKQDVGKVLWGLALVVAGIIIGGNALGYWDFSVFFDGWWTLFIIVPCLYSMYDSGIHTGNVIGLSLGCLFLSAALNIISKGLVSQLVFPIILVIIGIKIIGNGFREK
ncbi:MAG: LiaF transmembrane domain-containing protein [Turicibacter sp.]